MYVITGAARGIGLATAEALAAEGARVVLVDREADALADRATALGAAVVGTFQLDVTDEDALTELAAMLEQQDSVAGLVNAAGVFQKGSAYDVTTADWDRVLDINLKGTFLTCRALLPVLERDGGAIVNLSSISGRTKSIHAAPDYSASKAGVIGLTMTLAAQHAARGVRVNCVAPGLIDTPMLDAYTPEQRASAVSGVPLGRLGTAAEVAACVVFLLSGHASYVTGHTLNVNGGAFMQ
ncbi:SDR family oxidoreductase [Actinomadura mexicana]|uniref:SDR family oxidoreductase n=1 Tax=Actinomadura mexicana TaxID=134959 RepID=UPI0015C5937A|nr:SDR family NAD(P)-dependent oxidoreductase [Actinomadura mexicana]